jgi:hypothetical protein
MKMPKRLIDTELWNNEQIVEDFTSDDKYFWLYLLTNPHGSICGVMKYAPAIMGRDMGLHKDTIENLVYRFENNYKLIVVDKETKELLILNWYKWNWSTSEKLLQSVFNSKETIKSEYIKNLVQERIDMVSEKKQEDTVSIGYGYPTISNTNIIDISALSVYSKILEMYKRCGYEKKAKNHKTDTIKKLKTICNNKDKKKRLHPLLVLMAYGVYLAECRDSHKEIEFVKQSDTFLTSMVYDYAEQVEGFEERVVQKYGENWEKYRLVE